MAAGLSPRGLAGSEPAARGGTSIGRWSEVEIYASFMKLTGELEVVAPDRLSDAVSQAERYLSLRDTRAEPLSVNYPVLSRVEPHTTIAKSAIILLCPVDETPPDAEPAEAARRPKISHQAVFNTMAFSLVGDVHLEPGQSLRDQLEADPLGFLPLTNVSALWVTALSSETHAVQRRFALLNPAAILSFSDR